MSLPPDRRRVLGGSDLAALLGDSPWATPLSVYARIVGGGVEDESSFARRGNRLERAALELYAEQEDVELLDAPRFVHRRLPYLWCSLDARGRRSGAGRHVVDAKTVNRQGARGFGEPGTDQVRRDILYQQTIYLGVGLSLGEIEETTADVPVLGVEGADVALYRVPFDAELFALLEEAAERFWRDHVEPRRPPPLTEPTEDIAALKALYPTHAEGARTWDSFSRHDRGVLSAWLLAKSAAKEASATLLDWEAKARLVLGDTPQLVEIPAEFGVTRVDFKQNEPSTITDWHRMTQDMGLALNVSPERYNEFMKRSTITQQGARPLVVRERKNR